MHVVVQHPWREAPKGDLTLLLNPDEPSLYLGVLPEDSDPTAGDEVEPAEIIGEFTLHRSPDERVPEMAERVARMLARRKPKWLEDRMLELLNNIHGFGTSRNPRGPQGKMGMDHPLAPLGVWGPTIDKVGKAVRAGRFQSFEDMEARLEPVVYQGIDSSIPEVLKADILGVRKPQMLIKAPL